MLDILIQILNSLNAVEVRGKTNLAYQLGAIQALEQLIASQKSPKTIKAEKKEEK